MRVQGIVVEWNTTIPSPSPSFSTWDRDYAAPAVLQIHYITKTEPELPTYTLEATSQGTADFYPHAQPKSFKGEGNVQLGQWGSEKKMADLEAWGREHHVPSTENMSSSFCCHTGLEAVVWGMAAKQNCLFSFLAGDPELSAISKGTPSQPISIYTYCL